MTRDRAHELVEYFVTPALRPERHAQVDRLFDMEEARYKMHSVVNALIRPSLQNDIHASIDAMIDRAEWLSRTECINDPTSSHLGP